VTARVYDRPASVTLIVDAGDRPVQLDVTVSVNPLDEQDPRKPGDIIWHVADVDVEAFLGTLEVVANLLRGAP
jgi:hypothetical protein